MCIDIVDLYKLHLNILISVKEEWKTEIDVTKVIYLNIRRNIS